MSPRSSSRRGTAKIPTSASALDFFAIGDTALDVFVEIEDGAVHCSLDTRACEISFAFGEKVPVKSVQKFPGAGNASNAAVASRRLGRNSAIFSTVGSDDAGRMILQHWKQEGVDVKFVDRSHDLATNEHIVLTFKGERTILVHHHPYSYALPLKLPGAKRVYYSSLAKGHEHLERELIEYLDAHPSVKLTFQPGTFQLRRLARGTTEILTKTDLIVMNREEAAQFLEQPASAPIHDQLNRFLELGPRIAVITDGEHGSYAAEGNKAWSCPSFPVPCIERTGAGDAYATTFSWAIDKGFSIPESMRYATANSASVIQFIGPQAGLLSRDGVERLLRKYHTICPSMLAI